MPISPEKLLEKLQNPNNWPWGAYRGTPGQAISYGGPHEAKGNPKPTEAENEPNPEHPTTTQK